MTTPLAQFRQRLRDPQFPFAETLAFVEQHYQYSPTAFGNGSTRSDSGQNEGSCKVFGLALLEGLDAEETLLAFGEHYRSVLATPESSDHGNIRAFMVSALQGLSFDHPPLSRKAA